MSCSLYHNRARVLTKRARALLSWWGRWRIWGWRPRRILFIHRSYTLVSSQVVGSLWFLTMWSTTTFPLSKFPFNIFPCDNSNYTLSFHWWEIRTIIEKHTYTIWLVFTTVDTDSFQRCTGMFTLCELYLFHLLEVDSIYIDIIRGTQTSRAPVSSAPVLRWTWHIPSTARVQTHQWIPDLSSFDSVFTLFDSLFSGTRILCQIGLTCMIQSYIVLYMAYST